MADDSPSSALPDALEHSARLMASVCGFEAWDSDALASLAWVARDSAGASQGSGERLVAAAAFRAAVGCLDEMSRSGVDVAPQLDALVAAAPDRARGLGAPAVEWAQIADMLRRQSLRASQSPAASPLAHALSRFEQALAASSRGGASLMPRELRRQRIHAPRAAVAADRLASIRWTSEEIDR